MAQIEAILFDLYGTLLKISRRSIHREIPRLLQVDRGRWTQLVRRDLLTRPFEDSPAFVRFVCDALAPGHDPAVELRCLASLRSEIESVHPFTGTTSLLHFLKRRGYRLGLVSNLASAYKEPLERFELAPLFDAVAFSCDEGVVKPEKQMYLDVCRRLGVEPSQALFVGDSAANDVAAPEELGMLTAGIGVGGADARLEAISELGCLALSDGHVFERLLAPGRVLEVGSTRYRAEAIEPVPDEAQGRYNLVFAVTTRDSQGAPARLYCKRFLDPQAASVEEFAYELQKMTSMSACEAAVIDGPEPYLAMTAAPGRKYAGELTPAIGYELGKHFVFAFLFSNADMRPRNAFLSEEDGESRVTLIDLEHCFFNLAMDASGVADPFRPESFDRMSAVELQRRVKKRVLTQRATSRARRSFFGDTPREAEVTRAFREGFLDSYRVQRNQSDLLCDRIAERIDREPPLVIGTLSYRRAMARVDLEDIRFRLALEPEAAFEWCY